jgi:tetratricopeptide (TPR) repeat protein/pimeloyl-ACP methyl ester carboxylesterase
VIDNRTASPGAWRRHRLAARDPASTRSGRLLLAAGSVAMIVIGAWSQPAGAATIYAWARCMGLAGRPAVAIGSCSAIIASGKETPDNLPYAYLFRGRAHASCQEGDLAAKDFTAALQGAPDLAHAHFWLGEIYKTREDWPRAAEEFGKAAASNAEDADSDSFTADSLGQFRADPLTEHGFALSKQGDVRQALAAFAAASVACPTCSAPYRDKALVLAAAGRYADAEAADDQAIARNPRSAAAFLARGILRARMSRDDQAIAYYSEAIRVYPDYDIPYKARARAYARLGMAKEAADDDRRAVLLQETLERKRKTACDAEAPASAPAGAGGADKAAAAATLDGAALTALFSGKTWQARQGIWQADLEFRADGSFRQRSKDQTEGSTLAVKADGAWGIADDELCIFTGVALCLRGHVEGGTVSLTRSEDGVLEYSGEAARLKDSGADMASSPIAELPLDEQFLPGTRGAAQGGKTLLYYIHGFDGVARGHSPVRQYFLARMQEAEGWDVIDADYPRRTDGEVMRFEASTFGAASYVARRLAELKRQGYDRIIVGGQSWGGWISLVLSTERNLPLDGVILEVPAFAMGFGEAKDGDFVLNKLYFDERIKRTRYPTVAIFFTGDFGETADRGMNAVETLTAHGVPNLVIDHPPGFNGHGAAWFPVFDYEFRDCIVSFLLAPKTAQCEPVEPSDGDFRTIFAAAQLKGRAGQAVSPSELIGKRFAVYPNGDVQTIVSAARTKVEGYGMGETEDASAFRDGLYCITPRVKFRQPAGTDETCVSLVRWSPREVLALDRTSGNVVQWWVEQ